MAKLIHRIWRLPGDAVGDVEDPGQDEEGNEAGQGDDLEANVLHEVVVERGPRPRP